MRIREDVLKLAFPILMEQVLVLTMGTVNAIISSHIGKEAVSAIGMVDSINNVFISFFSALAVGGTVVVAHYTGQNDTSDANEAAKQGLIAGILIALAITGALWLFQGPVIRVLYGSAEQDVLNNVYMYLSITLITYPLIAITSIACGVLRGAGDTRTPMKITVLMNGLNIILSYILIYGLDAGNSHFHLYIPSLGVKGAALGIALARTVGAGLIMHTLIRGSKIIKIDKIHKFRFNIGIQKSIFSIGIPASVESLLFTGGKLITQIFIVGMGTIALAANYVGTSVVTLTNIPGSAISIAATTLVGQAMGRGESKEAKETMIYLVKLSSFCLFLVCLISFPTAKFLASLYSGDNDIINQSAVLIRQSALCTPILWSLAFMLPAGLKGAGDTRYTMVTSIIGMWAFRITLGYILGVPLKLGVPGIWFGMYVDWLVRGILYYIRLKNGKWMKNVVIKDNIGEAV